jgi:hypothetical protein
MPSHSGHLTLGKDQLYRKLGRTKGHSGCEGSEESPKPLSDMNLGLTAETPNNKNKKNRLFLLLFDSFAETNMPSVKVSVFDESFLTD